MKILFLKSGYVMGFTKSKRQYVTGFWRYLKPGSSPFKKISLLVKRERPEIVALAEIDSGSARTNFTSQVDLLKREGGFADGIFQCKYKSKPLRKLPISKNQGNAVLAKKGLSASHWFHYLDYGIKRLVIEVKFGSSFNLFLVHLALSRRSRQKQIKQLLSYVKGSEQPVIVAGDFNLFKGSGEIDDLIKEGGLKSANKNHQPTFPSWKPKKELDFFLVSPSIKIKSFKVLS
ncbi:MAG: endonuclease/exonuclease/phosphatase family protein, partial [Patescibacteria group bacterium]|nr:endonuclease/exonuclease/phosphatase family protein [Patescibacteria group bacterium]